MVFIFCTLLRILLKHFLLSLFQMSQSWQSSDTDNLLLLPLVHHPFLRTRSRIDIHLHPDFRHTLTPLYAAGLDYISNIPARYIVKALPPVAHLQEYAFRLAVTLFPYLVRISISLHFLCLFSIE